MGTPRWSAKSFTAVAGNPIAAADINTEHDRIVTLADDIGGDVAADYDGDETDLLDIVNAHLKFKPIPLMVPGAAFRPLVATDGDAAVYNVQGEVYDGVAYGTNPEIDLIAPIHLPVGTWITGMDVWGDLTHTGATVEVRLRAYDPATDTAYSGITSVTKTGESGGNFHEASSYYSHVIQEGFSYFLTATLTNGDGASQAGLRAVQLKWVAAP